MASTVSPIQADQKLTGEALRNLRERRGLRQVDIARAFGMTPQGWQPYETGLRGFTTERIATALEVMNMTEADLDEERNRILGRPSPKNSRERNRELIFDVYGRARAGAQGIQIYDAGEPVRTIDLRQILGPDTDALEVAGDSMIPWAEPGEVVLFDRNRFPKRGAGCVIETHTGEYYVKLYEKSDGSTLFVKELNPEERILTFAMIDVKGVYGVRLRGD